MLSLARGLDYLTSWDLIRNSIFSLVECFLLALKQYIFEKIAISCKSSDCLDSKENTDNKRSLYCIPMSGFFPEKHVKK